MPKEIDNTNESRKKEQGIRGIIGEGLSVSGKALTHVLNPDGPILGVLLVGAIVGGGTGALLALLDAATILAGFGIIALGLVATPIAAGLGLAGIAGLGGFLLGLGNGLSKYGEPQKDVDAKPQPSFAKLVDDLSPNDCAKLLAQLHLKAATNFASAAGGPTDGPPLPANAPAPAPRPFSNPAR